MKSAKLLGMMAMGGVLALSLAGCGGKTMPKPMVNGDDGNAASRGVVNAVEADLDDQVSIDREYSFPSYGEDAIRHVIVFTNHSSKTVLVGSETQALGEDGSVLGNGAEYADGIAPNSAGVIEETIEDARKATSFKTTLSASESAGYEAAQNLNTKVSIKEDEALVKVTNNGEETADNVKVQVLFMKNGKVVDYEDEFIYKKLGPGKSASSDVYSYSSADFDSAEVYVTGSVA